MSDYKPQLLPLVIVDELSLDSLDDGGEALITAVSDSDTDAGIWVRVISNLGYERMVEIEDEENRSASVADHSRLSAFIGHRVRVVVEVMD